jgi:polyhydroxybutyrate depolymerase
MWIRRGSFECYQHAPKQKPISMNRLSTVSFFTLLTALLMVSCKPPEIKHGILHESINIEGQKREYILYLPKDLSNNAPLVFVCHGYTGNAEGMMKESRMNPVADANGFAVCYPQGLLDKDGKPFWEVGYSFTQDRKVDDVQFLTNLAAHLQGKYHLSQANTFAAGMSNGGDMSIMLACNAPHVFKAVAPVCGSLMKIVHDTSANAIPVPVFMINSTADKITSWEGDMAGSQGWGPYLPTLTTFEFFVAKNKCTQSAIDTLPNINEQDSSFVISEKHTNGTNGNQVWLYKVVNGGHDWPGSSGNMDIDAAAEVWGFFKVFIRQETGCYRLSRCKKGSF